jgi:hypothetical protein
VAAILHRELLPDVGRVLDPLGYLFPEALRLPDNPARRDEHSATALLQPLAIERAFAARCSHDLEHPQLYAASPIAQPGD